MISPQPACPPPACPSRMVGCLPTSCALHPPPHPFPPSTEPFKDKPMDQMLGLFVLALASLPSPPWWLPEQVALLPEAKGK